MTYRAPSSTHVVLAHLQHEWRHLCVRRSTVRRVQGWSLPVQVVSLDDLLAALGDRRLAADRSAASHGADELLQLVLTIARDDELAGRVVLQRLLPGLISIARRWQRRCPEDSFDELLTVAWTVIRTFPLERGPEFLAAKLLADCEYRAFIKQARRLLVQLPAPVDEFELIPAEARSEPLGELIEVVRCAGGLSEHERHLLGLLLAGRQLREVAAVLHLSERTVRAHRDAMVERWRGALAA